jgi:hypothetical protein
MVNGWLNIADQNAFFYGAQRRPGHGPEWSLAARKKEAGPDYRTRVPEQQQ